MSDRDVQPEPTPSPDVQRVAREAAEEVVRVFDSFLDEWDIPDLTIIIARHFESFQRAANQRITEWEARLRDREAEIYRLRTAENHAACELGRLRSPGGPLHGREGEA